YLVGNFALSIEALDNFAAELADRYLTGVPVTEVNTYLPSLEQVTATEAQAAAAKYIADQPIIVVVGDAAVIKAQLEEIGHQVVVVDSNGQTMDN
ncbi:MAG: hypothetical protein HYR94_29610, partial [Chloroflexi bacterium]|nr:hypothetical protein [Chloroflexota bacterium]